MLSSLRQNFRIGTSSLHFQELYSLCSSFWLWTYFSLHLLPLFWLVPLVSSSSPGVRGHKGFDPLLVLLSNNKNVPVFPTVFSAHWNSILTPFYYEVNSSRLNQHILVFENFSVVCADYPFICFLSLSLDHMEYFKKRVLLKFCENSAESIPTLYEILWCFISDIFFICSIVIWGQKQQTSEYSIW